MLHLLLLPYSQVVAADYVIGIVPDFCTGTGGIGGGIAFGSDWTTGGLIFNNSIFAISVSPHRTS